MRKPLDHMHWTERTTLLFLFKHLIAGAMGGLFFGFLILYFDVGNIWSMMAASQDGILVCVMMFSGLILTFGSIGMGWGIFGLAQERDEPPRQQNYY